MRAPSRSLLALSLLTTVSLASGPARARDLQCPTDFHVPIRVTLAPPSPCAGDSVFAVFHACSQCPTLVGVSNTDSGVVVQASISDPLACLTKVKCSEESLSYSLGMLAAGHFTFNFKYVTQLTVRDSVGDSLTCMITNLDSLAFNVAKTCGPTPPPGPLPFVSAVHIGSPGACDTCPPVACPGESIQVVIQGAFDSSCLSFVGLEEVLPLAPRTSIPSPGPIPAPPMIRLIYDRLACAESTCTAGTFPWSTRLTLPPLPSRSAPYELAIAAAEREVSCSGPTDSITMLGSSTFPFTVATSCSSVVAPRCLQARFDVAGGSEGRCDAFISPGHSTTVKLLAGSGVSLFGLQGDLKFSPPKLRVANIQTIGPAAGMHLQWQNTDHGAKFVLYSDGKSHIPPIDSALAAVLQIDVAQGTEDSGPGKSGDKGSPPKIRMDLENLLGADGSANAVHPCATPEDDDEGLASVEFCPGSGCDFNGDGSVDVRDLVAMILCMHDSTSCPPGASPPDCNGNGVFDLPDVMCCANEILHGDHPGKGGHGHDDSSIAMNFGTPVDKGGLVEIPVTLDGDHPIGGATLTFSFPSDRYVLRDVVFPSNPNCLGIFQGGTGQADVGLLELGDLIGSTSLKAAREARMLAASAAHHTFTLRLALKPGQTVGGDVSLTAADIADPTGALVTTHLGTPIASLGGGDLMLAPARPNPFGRSVSFAVTMAKPGDLEVTIHDVSGRVVATLSRGSVAAGAHLFTWDGTRSDGSRAANGIYFYRARGNGQTLSSKLVFIREE